MEEPEHECPACAESNRPHRLPPSPDPIGGWGTVKGMTEEVKSASAGLFADVDRLLSDTSLFPTPFHRFAITQKLRSLKACRESRPDYFTAAEKERLVKLERRYAELCDAFGLSLDVRLPTDEELEAARWAERLRPRPGLNPLAICPRCRGYGYLYEFKHVQDGICFKCGGRGQMLPLLFTCPR